jgi:hypothetical protein
MSTIQKVNFEPVSDILPVWRKDLPLADASLADPTNAVALVDGEWLTIDTNYKWVRAAAVATPGTLATVRSFICFSERGRSDRMGMADKKTTGLFRGEYEADTRVFDASVALGSGAAITTVLQPLKVATITVGSRNYVGLVGHGGSSDASPVVGYVTRLPASNGGKLRFISGYRS